MRIAVGLLALVGSVLAQGIPWSKDLNASLKRARVEGRPILVAINALDMENGNQAQLRSYQNQAMVAVAQSMVCLVANPNNHGTGKTCSRYGSTDCATHKAVLTYAMRRWSPSGDLISPHHMILKPDGTLIWKQEYLIGIGALRQRCESALVSSAPHHALKLAGQTRQRQLKSLLSGGSPSEYMKSGDPLAPAVLLLAWEDDEDDKWLTALKRAPREAFGLVRLYLEDEPVFLSVAKAMDAKRGAWWSKRLHAKAAKPPPPHNAKLKSAFLKLKKGDASGLDKLLAALPHPVDGPEVRAALADLAGVDHGPDPAGWKEQFAK